jgi:NCS1 family nucleobase:cation symporter-1
VDLTQYQNFLFLVGSLFTPLFGVLFADYFLLRRRVYARAELYPTSPGAARQMGINPVALIAWAAGIASYLLVINVAPWLGGTLPSLGASLVVYVALTKLRRSLAR